MRSVRTRSLCGNAASSSGLESTTSVRSDKRPVMLTSAWHTWPAPKITSCGSAAAKHSSSTVMLPPQHCCASAPSANWRSSWQSCEAASNSRARLTTSCSRPPPPMEATTAAGVTSILLPLSRGVEPLVAITVASACASPRWRHASSAAAQLSRSSSTVIGVSRWQQRLSPAAPPNTPAPV